MAVKKHVRYYRSLFYLLVIGLILGLPVNFSSAAWKGVFLPLIGRYWPLRPVEINRVLISEVLADPTGDQPAGEWIELYNPGNITLDLSSLRIGDAESYGDGEGMFHFPEGAQIIPGQVITVANQGNYFLTNYGFSPDFELVSTHPDIRDMIKSKDWATGSVNLSADDDEVLVLGEGDLIVDSLSWGNSTFAFDPPIARVDGGHSFERKPANADRDQAGDWSDQPKPAPGVIDLNLPTPTPTRRPSPTPTGTATATPTPLPCGGSTLLITEIMYDPVGSLDPYGEWVEIYNFGDSDVNLGCVKLGDEETPGGGESMLLFPEKLLAPDGVIVVAEQATTFFALNGSLPDYEIVDSDPSIENLLRYTSWASGSFNLNNSDDEVIILGPDDEILDAVSWGSSTFAFDPGVVTTAEGYSLERLPANQDTNSAADWQGQAYPNPGEVVLVVGTPTPTVTHSTTPTRTTTCTLTPTRTRLPCGPAPLLISEVFYDPAYVSDPDGEWVEIYNLSGGTVNLACVKVGDEESRGGGEGMLVFPEGALLLPGEVVVVANRAASFQIQFGFKPDYEIYDSIATVPQMLKYSTWSTGLVNWSNTTDEVLLLDGENQLIDAVSWGSSTFAFDPPARDISEGHSLERRPANLDQDRAADWIDQEHPDPGEINLSGPVFTATPTSTRTSTQTPTRTATPTSTPTRTSTPTITSEPTSGIVINEIYADPHLSQGDANGDGIVDTNEDVFVEIVNARETQVDISGWVLRDVTSVRHIFHPGTLIPSGCAVLVFGGGEPVGNFGYSLVQVATSGELVLSPRGDTVTIVNMNGIPVASYSYEIEADDSQSITRYPDVNGPEPLVKHSTVAESGGALFSAGTKVDGSFFEGCLHLSP